MEKAKQRYVLSVDQGTTGTRAMVFDANGNVAASAYRKLRQFYPTPGWVEHDPVEIAEAVRSVVQEATQHIDADDIEAIGIANQRETTIAWDKVTGKPLYNAIVWQCRRTARSCEMLEEAGCGPLIYEKTGLMPDAYFSATKMQWLMENVPAVAEAAEQKRLCLGTVDTYLMYALSGGEIFATDHTNASRTMLYNIHKRAWDDDLLELFGIPREALAQVYPSGHRYGAVHKSVLGREIPICAVAGDQQAALFGQRCFSRGSVKCTFGTGCFLLCNTGGESIASKRGLITTIAVDADGQPCYALEGSVFAGGAAVQWLRDEMGLLTTAQESEELARSVPDSGGVYVVPAFVGLGAPYWDSAARGMICGITRGVSRAHVVRATLESIAYQCFDVLHAMSRDTGIDFSRLAVDGGASANNFLMQFASDISGASIVRPRVVETTSLGVAMLAAHVFGGETSAILQKGEFTDRTFSPQIDNVTRDELIEGWCMAVARCRYK